MSKKAKLASALGSVKQFVTKKGYSKGTIGKNIATEINAGKDPKQAAAIAYSIARKAADNKGVNPSHLKMDGDMESFTGNSEGAKAGWETRGHADKAKQHMVKASTSNDFPTAYVHARQAGRHADLASDIAKKTGSEEDRHNALKAHNEASQAYTYAKGLSSPGTMNEKDTAKYAASHKADADNLKPKSMSSLTKTFSSIGKIIAKRSKK